MEATVRNQGDRFGHELVQLYVRDLVGSVTRPVRELKGFQWVCLDPGEERVVRFDLHTEDLAFYGRDLRWGTEPGRFQVWVGSDAAASLVELKAMRFPLGVHRGRSLSPSDVS